VDQLTRRNSIANAISSQQDWENYGNTYIFPTALELYTIRVEILTKQVKCANTPRNGDVTATTTTASAASDSLMEELFKFVSACPEQWDAHEQSVQSLVARGCRADDIARYRQILDAQKTASSSNRSPFLGELHLSCALLSHDCDLLPTIQLMEDYVLRFGNKLVCASDLNRPLTALCSNSSATASGAQLKEFAKWCYDRLLSLLGEIEALASGVKTIALSAPSPAAAAATSTTTLKTQHKSKGKQKAGHSKSSSTVLSPQTQLEQHVEARSRRDTAMKDIFDLLGHFVTASRLIEALISSSAHILEDSIASTVPASTLVQAFSLGRQIKQELLNNHAGDNPKEINEDSELLPSDELLNLIASSLAGAKQLAFNLLAQKLVPKNLQWTLRGIRSAISLSAGKLIWQQYLQLGVKHVQLMTITPAVYPSIVQVRLLSLLLDC
jgi:hypothetical protein